MCYNLFCWWKSQKFFNKTDYSLYNRHKLYLQGVEKFHNEIDVLNYTKSLRLLKILLSSLMDDSEKFMSTYQHQNWIKLINCDLCKEETPKNYKIPNLICKISDIENHTK